MNGLGKEKELPIILAEILAMRNNIPFEVAAMQILDNMAKKIAETDKDLQRARAKKLSNKKEVK